MNDTSKIRRFFEVYFGKTLGDKLVDALKRAAWTFVETLAGAIITAATFDVDWKALITIAGVATITSFMKSMAYGVPETNRVAGTLMLTDEMDDGCPLGGISWADDITADMLSRCKQVLMVVDDQR